MIRDYEVLVAEIDGKGAYYSERLKKYVVATTRKWIHIEGVRSHDQAVAVAQKSGRRVLGVRKFDPTRSLELGTDVIKSILSSNIQPPMTAIQMDELVVNNKQQRKLENKWKDKIKVFRE